MYNEQVLLGSLLGDGCLTFSKRNINPLYSECHSIKQLKYLEWKNQFFKCKIKPRKTYLKKTGKWYDGYYFRAGANAFFLQYYYLFYKDGKKSVNNIILGKLKPLAVAVWFCDDGSYSYYNNNIKICVAGFSLRCKQLMSDYFKETYGIDFKIQKECIYLSSDDTKKFISVIKKHVPECMHYKLGMDAEKQSTQRQRNRLKCKNYWHTKKMDPEWIKKERLRLRNYMRIKRSNS